jgi:DNA polymerase-3 subunit alpha
VIVGDFVSLHHHSTFSYGDGFGTPEVHVQRAVDLEMSAMALTEHGNVTSHVKLEKHAKAAGIKPIFGCELYTGGVGDTANRFKWHLTVLAQTQEGLRNLNAMVSEGWQEGFYYEPTVSWDNLVRHNEGLIVLSGCSGSKLATDLLGGKGREEHKADLDAAKNTAAAFRDLLGDRFYLEMQSFPELKKTRHINRAYMRISEDLGIPYVATGDVHYPFAKDNEMQLMLHAIDRSGKTKGKAGTSVERQAQGWEYGIPMTLFKDGMIRKKLMQGGMTRSQADRAIQESAQIASRINVELPKLKELQFPSAEGMTSKQMFRNAVRAGWKYRGVDKWSKKDRKWAKERVRMEAGLIELKKFDDYFLVVSDMVVFAKDSGIPVGPARGSAAASFICWLMRITEVNPMHFPNLIFERFIDLNRHDLPDIDLDFDDEQRYLIREYLVEKYGEDRVGNIGTFTNFRGKNSLDDIARVNSIPKFATDGIKEMLIERASGDLRGNATIEDTIEMFPKVKDIFDQYPVLYKAQRLEGNLKGFSLHAAGLVVANEPLTNSVAVYARRDKDDNIIGNVLSIDKHDAEYINALKIDVLGLTTMGMINRCLKMVGMTLEELYAVPLDEEEVFAGFRRNEVIGIFQFDGRAMRSVNREVKPDNFAEICDINALARPGPLHSGAAAEYIMVKHGKKKADILHPVVGEITAHTNRQIVYQEQILRVVRELGNFTWEEAALIRKLISKKQGEQAFNRMMSKFIKGAMENGMTEGNATKVWKQLVTAGAYAFNAAHCVSYGMLAYWTMWLKQKYPLEFYCAALQKYDPNTKGFDLLKEAMAKGIHIMPPDPQHSEMTWAYSKEHNALYAGFEQIKGIGEKTGTAMLEYREEHGVTDWDDYINVKGIGQVTMDKVKVFCSDPDPFGIQLLGNTLRKTRAFLFYEGEAEGFPTAGSKSEDVPYEAKRGNHTWIGMVRERNLKDIYELHRSRTGEELNPDDVKEPEYVNYVVITGEDETGPLRITVPRYRGFYEKNKDTIWNMDLKRDLLLVKGYKRAEYNRAITATEIWVINPDNIKERVY